MHNNQPTALFHSIIAVTALCSDHAERLGAMSAIFKANIRFESDEDTVETGSVSEVRRCTIILTCDRPAHQWLTSPRNSSLHKHARRGIGTTMRTMLRVSAIHRSFIKAA